jgi:hypothetical protein
MMVNKNQHYSFLVNQQRFRLSISIFSISRNNARATKGSALAESPLALFVMTIFLFFMISMFSLLTGYATLYFATQSAAREAGASQTSTAARAAVQRTCEAIIAGPLGQFGGISPKTSAGMTIRAFRVIDGGNPEPIAISAGGNVVVDQTRYSYTYVIDSRYSITPVLFPIAFPVQAQSTCAVEHPEGIAL